MKLDSSRINTYASCPRQYQYKYVENLRKTDYAEASAPRQFGKAIHSALEEYYKTGKQDVALDIFRADYENTLDANDFARTTENGVTLLKNYFTYYSEQDKNWEIIDAEIKDSFEIDDIKFTVVLDIVARNKQGGGIYFWDHKTKDKMFGSGDAKHFDVSEQFTAYSYYIRKKYGQCSGAYVNAIVFGHRKNKYKDEPAGFWNKFERHVTNRSNQQIDEWVKNVRMWRRMIDFSEVNNAYPMHTGKLCAYCDYYELCLSSNNEQVKSSIYTEEKK